MRVRMNLCAVIVVSRSTVKNRAHWLGAGEGGNGGGAIGGVGGALHLNGPLPVKEFHLNCDKTYSRYDMCTSSLSVVYSDTCNHVLVHDACKSAH